MTVRTKSGFSLSHHKLGLRKLESHPEKKVKLLKQKG
jgi:hypothetical protein